jgi:hypothetical protein
MIGITGEVAVSLPIARKYEGGGTDLGVAGKKSQKNPRPIVRG